MRSCQFTVSEEEEGERLDRLLSSWLPDLSRTYLQKLLKEGDVHTQGRIEKASYKVREGDSVEVSVPDETPLDVKPQDIPLDILYEDDDVLVVNKPKGMVVHPAAGHADGTLVNAVLYHCKGNLSGINGVLRPGIVHRIDKDTTGSVIVCKNDAAHRSIAEQLRQHTIVRRYYAIVYGVIADDDLTIDRPIGRDSADRKKMAVTHAPNGKTAVTHVHVLERFGGFTYVECRLETGRTHQIRVHMASIGHPVLGDNVYAGGRSSPFSGLQGQCLHAGVLAFVHPKTGALIETSAPLPAYFEHLLEVLRSGRPVK
ncbi:MAG: RluA family pseudouridine synthase [Lachnospiraceae bacterium]|jgi:23S rRNA pseudouridine1911/1915/1917 synthase|nr:RluA family pseudouridine synthase [Lachnospiraceae bacterium]